MKEMTQEILLDLESKLEEKARMMFLDDSRMSQLRLQGYLDGMTDFRIELFRYLREKNENNSMQESGVDGDYDTDLIREIVEMHKKIVKIHEMTKAMILLLNQIDFLGGKNDVEEFFGKDVGNGNGVGKAD